MKIRCADVPAPREGYPVGSEPQQTMLVRM
jgi:hypothetical protein